MEKRILFSSSTPKDIFIIGVDNPNQTTGNSFTIDEQSLQVLKNSDTSFNFDVINAITINTLEDFTKDQVDFKRLAPSKTKILYIPNFSGDVILNYDYNNNDNNYLELPFCYVYETTIGVNINEIDTAKLNEVGETTKEPIIGEFKPKRKFISFISGLKGAKIRFNRDSAFIEGDKLSGMLDGTKFKITICGEGTINFEEVGTNLTTKKQIQGFIDDLDEKDVSGYTEKFIIANLQFTDVDGNLCYLEVEHKKPIDRLLGFLDDDENTNIVTPTEVSKETLNKLDFLFTEEDVEDTIEEESIENEEEDITTPKSMSYEEELFKKMEEDKKKELNTRIDNKTKEIRKTKSELDTINSKLNTYEEELKILNSRLESMTTTIEPNGYIFFISEEVKSDIDFKDLEIDFIDKLCKVLNVKKDVLINKLTGGYYKISISDENDISKIKPTNELYNRILQIDPLCKLSVDGDDFIYSGDLDWHQLVDKMLKLGFTQKAEFNKLCNSNSYGTLESTYQSLGNGMGILMESSRGGSSEPEAKTEEEIKAKIKEAQENNWDESYYYKKLRRLQNSEEIEKLESELENPNLSDIEKLHIENKIQHILDGKPEFKCEEIITFDKPTDLVLIGCPEGCIDNLYEEEIYDDECSIKIYKGGQFLTDMNMCGSFMILTINNYKQLVKTTLTGDEEGEVNIDIDAFLLPSFKGTLYKGFRMPDGAYITSKDNIGYAQYTFFLNLPENTNILKIENHDLSLLRDVKLNNLLKEKPNNSTSKTDPNKKPTRDDLISAMEINDECDYYIDNVENVVECFKDTREGYYEVYEDYLRDPKGFPEYADENWNWESHYYSDDFDIIDPTKVKVYYSYHNNDNVIMLFAVENRVIFYMLSLD